MDGDEGQGTLPGTPEPQESDKPKVELPPPPNAEQLRIQGFEDADIDAVRGGWTKVMQLRESLSDTRAALNDAEEELYQTMVDKKIPSFGDSWKGKETWVASVTTDSYLTVKKQTKDRRS